MSEHEGFCVPLIEAMWFDVPVLAFKSSAVPETLGEAALMFTSKKDLKSVAALARLVVKDPNLRAKVIRGQRRRRLSFLPAEVEPLLAEMLWQMEGNGPAIKTASRDPASS
jgi:glycosyltransferase involved in cell wall biosynthesis